MSKLENNDYNCRITKQGSNCGFDNKKTTFKVKVRWWDGYFEEFDAIEARAGAYLLWIKFEDGNTRHIPLIQVRWFNGLK